MIPYKKDAGSKSDILFTVNLCLFTVVLNFSIHPMNGSLSPKMKYGTGILTASIPMDLILVKSLSVMYSERWILILAS